MVQIPVLRWRYDLENDSLYLYKKYAPEAETSLKLDDGVNLYFDVDKVPCAFEYINISKLFELEDFSIDDFRYIRVSISITRRSIELSTELNLFVDEKPNISEVICKIYNNYSLSKYFKEYLFQF